MSFLKTILRSICWSIGKIIAYFIIGFLIFFIFGKLSNAQSLTWTRPRTILLTNSPTNDNYVTQCVDSIYCGNLSSNNTYSKYTSFNYRINQNNQDTSIGFLPKANYQLSLSGTIRTTTKISSKSITSSNFAILVFYSNSYHLATCDGTSKVTSSNYSDNSNRISFTYECSDLLNNRDDINFVGVRFNTSSYITYSIVSSNLSLLDLTDPNKSIIDNQNQNAQDIINNQNQNQEQTNDRLDDINNTLIDDNVNSSNFNFNYNFDDSPISSLITMPIKFIQLFNNYGSCSSISVPSFFGNFDNTGNSYNIPCYQVTNVFPDNLANLIDIIFVVFSTIGLSELFIYVFNQFKNLNDLYDEYYTPKHTSSGYKPRHGGDY